MTRYALKAVFAAAMIAATGIAQAATLTVVINGVEESVGEIRLALYNSAEGFDKGGDAIQRLLRRVDGDGIKITLADLAPGQYGIKLFHDANGNGELDLNMMGMPAERYGFSGNKGRRGPPPWADAAFDVQELGDNTIVIELR